MKKIMHDLGLYISKEHGNLLIIRDITPGIKLPKDIVLSEDEPFLKDISMRYNYPLKKLVSFLRSHEQI